MAPEGRPRVARLAAVLGWALRERRAVRRRLPREGVATRAAAPPALVRPRIGLIAIALVMGPPRGTCLERSLLQQAWLAQHGWPRDVVVGVRRAGGFGAHAWLEGYTTADGHEVIHRLPWHGAGAVSPVRPRGDV